MVGNPEDRSSRWGPDNFYNPVSFPQIDILCFFFITTKYVSNVLTLHIWALWACVITMHSVTDIRVPPVPIQPKTFRFPQRSLDLRSLSKEVFSRRGSTVVTMKPNISCYTYRSQNLDEACILNGCSNWKDARQSVYSSFRKHDSLKYHQGSVLKVLC